MIITMPIIAKSKVGKLNLGDAFIIAGMKTVEERVLSPVIGNASLMSGGIKIALSLVSSKVIGGKWGSLLATAFAVDGTEDIASIIFGGGLLGGIFGSGNNNITTIGGKAEVI